MLKRLASYLVLPAEVTAFERTYLEKLNRVALYFFLAHLPVFVVLAAFNGTGPLRAAVLTGIVLVGPALAYRTVRNPRYMSIVSGFTAMCLGGLLVHFGRGAMQIEMYQTRDPDAGLVRLIMTDDPIELRQWYIVDGSGKEVHVGLDKVEIGIPLSNNLFVTPTMRRNMGRNK